MVWRRVQIKQEQGAPDSAAAKAFVLEGTHTHAPSQPPKTQTVDGWLRSLSACLVAEGAWLTARGWCAAAMARAQADESPRTLRAAQALAGQSPGIPQQPFPSRPEKSRLEAMN